MTTGDQARHWPNSGQDVIKSTLHAQYGIDHLGSKLLGSESQATHTHTLPPRSVLHAPRPCPSCSWVGQGWVGTGLSAALLRLDPLGGRLATLSLHRRAWLGSQNRDRVVLCTPSSNKAPAVDPGTESRSSSSRSCGGSGLVTQKCPTRVRRLSLGPDEAKQVAGSGESSANGRRGEEASRASEWARTQILRHLNSGKSERHASQRA